MKTQKSNHAAAGAPSQSSTNIRFVSAEDPAFEKMLAENLKYFPGATAFYIPTVRQYDHLYFQPNLKKDLSFLMMMNTTKPVAYGPLYVYETKKGLEFSYGGFYLRAPLFTRQVSAREQANIEAEAFGHIEQLAVQNNVYVHRAAIESVEVVSGRVLYNQLRCYGYQDCTSSTNIIELQTPREELWSKIRKSYRALIAKAQKKYQTFFLDSGTWSHESGEKYRLLHMLAAGRLTRPIETFEKMYDMIKEGNAYIVAILSEEQWVGASLYYRFNGNVYYGSSATDPSITSQEGVGHLGVWQSLLYSQKQGDQLFELGWQPFPDEKEYNSKLNAISMFKSGFGGKRITWYRGCRYFNRTETATEKANH